MTPEDRLALINRVCQVVYHETESWNDEGRIGTRLAYLAWAIAADTNVDWRPVYEHGIKCLFQQWFEEGDPVWQFIRT